MAHYVMSLLEGKVHYSRLQLQCVIETKKTPTSYIDSILLPVKESYEKKLKLAGLLVEHLPSGSGIASCTTPIWNPSIAQNVGL